MTLFFDNQMLAQIVWTGTTVAEISCPTKYFPEASSIRPWRCVVYGLGCVYTAVQYAAAAMGLWRCRRFPGLLKNSLKP